MILIIAMSQCNLQGPRERKREAGGPESERAERAGGQCAAGVKKGKGPQL